MQVERVKTMEELATVSGISRPTLSKYFHDPRSVRQSTRERIEAALEKYSYTPNVYAVNQNRLLTRNLGIVVPFLADPFFAEVARKIEALCVDAGFSPILLSSHGDPDREIANLDSLRAIKPAGVLLAPLGRRSRHDDVRAFCDQVPTILFDCDIEGVGSGFVGSNNSQSITLIVDYLCRTGEPPAFFEMRDAPNPNAVKRRLAYEAAMSALGHEPMLLTVDGQGWEFEEVGERNGAEIIRQHALPTNTVLCSNDRLAIGFLSAAFQAGLRVGVGHGRALRVAGHDDHPFARFTCPKLTTVAQNYDAIAGSSMEQLLGMIAEGAQSAERTTQLFDGKLLIRNSA